MKWRGHALFGGYLFALLKSGAEEGQPWLGSVLGGPMPAGRREDSMEVGAGLGGTCCPRDMSSASPEGSGLGWATRPATDLGFPGWGSSHPSLLLASVRTGGSG